MSSQSVIVVVWIFPGLPIPALFTNISIPSIYLNADLIDFWIESSMVISQLIYLNLGILSCLRSNIISGVFKSNKQTLQPSFKNKRTICSPIPADPPVMIAFLPLSRLSEIIKFL